MIDWVDQSCKAWGRCTRWILADTGEGYPSADTIAKANAGLLDAAARRSMSRHFGEVRLGDALDVANALNAEPVMPIPLRSALWAQYVAKARTKERATVLSEYLREPVSVTQYWRYLDRAHYFLAARLQAPVPRGKLLAQKSS